MNHSLRPRFIFALVLVGVVIGDALVATASTTPPPTRHPSSAAVALTSNVVAGNCPWVTQSINHSASPAVLADEVVSKMTLAQKAAFLILATYPPLENRNVGVPSLCIPPLTLSDGPNGVANGLTGVTQFPASIAVAASFDTSVAKSVGQAVAVEARTKGIDVVQGPELNLARVPQSGRIFETYGEDPYLSSVLGVANIEGIQSTGEMANAKHFTAYTQETARVKLNQIVPLRALNELYNVPFKAVVQQAHVASVMCSYGLLNGVYTCEAPYIYATLKAWGFTGFVRSDLAAVKNVAVAFRAGISMVKPASPTTLMDMVNTGKVPISDLNNAVRSVLRPMFSFGFIAHPLVGSLSATATTPAHAMVALHAAEAGVVLLKNSGPVLPLTSKTGSIAVIGTAAKFAPAVAGGGSSSVQAPYIVTPLTAIRSAVGNKVAVSYQPGGPATLDLDQLSDVDIVSGVPLKLVKPIKPLGEIGKGDVKIDLEPSVTAALATATEPGTGAGWDKWSFVVRAKKTGTYEISFQQIGDTWLYMNGNEIISSPGLHIRTDLSTTVHFVAGQKYTFSAKWFQVKGHPAPMFSLVDVTPQINAAVAAARKAKVAIIFAGDYDTEGADRPNMNLPGDANALIAAVAAVNPHTIVVLNTGGAVLMPWLSHVAGVLEAWYPGQEDGAAIAAVLTGAVNPSGRLPITFPTSASAMPATTDTSFPGVSSLVNFGSGLGVGYRWYQMNNVSPLFTFGYGLSYTSFKLSNASVTPTANGVTVHVTVTNTGSRTGADVVQVYVKYPPSAGEPPEQLRAFSRVQLSPSGTTHVTMTIPASGFEAFLHNSYTTVPGQYGIDIGQSSTDLPIHLSVTR